MAPPSYVAVLPSNVDKEILEGLEASNTMADPELAKQCLNVQLIKSNFPPSVTDTAPAEVALRSLNTEVLTMARESFPSTAMAAPLLALAHSDWLNEQPDTVHVDFSEQKMAPPRPLSPIFLVKVDSSTAIFALLDKIAPPPRSAGSG